MVVGGWCVCVLGISDLTAASTYDVAVVMEHGRKSVSVCINSTSGKVLSSVNSHVSTICRAQWKHWHAVCVELRIDGMLESFCRMVCDCWTLTGIGYALGLYATERDWWWQLRRHNCTERNRCGGVVRWWPCDLTEVTATTVTGADIPRFCIWCYLSPDVCTKAQTGIRINVTPCKNVKLGAEKCTATTIIVCAPAQEERIRVLAAGVY